MTRTDFKDDTIRVTPIVFEELQDLWLEVGKTLAFSHTALEACQLAPRLGLRNAKRWIWNNRQQYDEGFSTGRWGLATGKFDGSVICQKDWEYLLTNVPRSVIQGSPDGHSWGYGGSGPHDLALDILNWHCPPKGQDCIKCFKGVCSNEAWRLRHQFVIDFLASMPEEGGAIPAEAIASWIEEHRIVDEENDYCY